MPVTSVYIRRYLSGLTGSAHRNLGELCLPDVLARGLGYRRADQPRLNSVDAHPG